MNNTLNGKCTKQCGVAGNLTRFAKQTIPGGAFIDKHTSWLDKWGSLP